MKNFNIITIFPDLIKSFTKVGFIKRAIIKKLITINNINLRDYSEDKHLKVDDKAYGGGPGMVLQYQPIQKAISKLNNIRDRYLISLLKMRKKYEREINGNIK